MVIARRIRTPSPPRRGLRRAFQAGLLTGLLLGLPAVPSSAGPPESQSAVVPGRFTLRDLERIVLRQDAGIASVRARLDEARGRRDETGSRFGPVFDVRYSRYPTGGDLPDDEGRVRQWLSVGVRQDYLELLKVKPDRMAETEAAVEGARARVQDAERQALYEVRLAYLDLVEATTKADAYARLASIREELYDIRGRRRVSRADLPPVLLETRQALIEAEGESRIQERAARRQRELLGYALGIPASAIVAELPDAPPPLPSEDSLAVLALRNRGAIRALEANARSERARAEAAPWEDVHLSSFLGYRVRDAGLSGTGSGLAVGLTFTMPLRFRGIGDGRRERFLSRERHWREEVRRAELDVAREIHEAYLAYARESERTLLAENKSRLEAERLRIERLRFASPVPGHETDLTTIREIEDALLMREMERTVSRCDALRAAFELLYLTGVYFPKEIGAEVEYVSTEVPDPIWEHGPPGPPPDRRLTSPGPSPEPPGRSLSAHAYPYGVAARGSRPPEEASREGRAMVQVIASSSLSAARQVAVALRREGWFAWIEPIDNSTGPTAFRVRVGPFETSEGAREASLRIAATLDLPVGCITNPPSIELSRAGRK